MKPSEAIFRKTLDKSHVYPESESAALYMARQNQNILNSLIEYLDEQYEISKTPLKMRPEND